MDNKNELENLEKKYDAALSQDNVGEWWFKWWKGAPSRICRLNIASSLYYHTCCTDKITGDVLPECEEDVERADNLIRPIMNKTDWEYMRYYCADRRYQKWVSEMQAKAPDKHPIDWE